MKLLPSQQNVAASEAENMLRSLKEGQSMWIDEPCNCQGQIRHNNGGNYHDEILIALDTGKYFVKYGSTSEFDRSEYEESSLSELILVARERAAEGYSFGVNE